MTDEALPGTCVIEVPSPLCASLQAKLSTEFYDSGIQPTNIIYCDQTHSAKVSIDFSGSKLARLMCLEWCAAINFESCGTAAEIDIPAQRKPVTLCYPEQQVTEFTFNFPPGTFDCDIKGCGTVYLMCVTVTAFDLCGEPAPFAGFCKVGPFMVFKPGTAL